MIIVPLVMETLSTLRGMTATAVAVVIVVLVTEVLSHMRGCTAAAVAVVIASDVVVVSIIVPLVMETLPPLRG